MADTFHIVFPVKYRRALLDGGVVEIIKGTVVGIQGEVCDRV